MKSKWPLTVAGVMLAAGLALVAAPQRASADTCTSQASGYWNSAGTWSCGDVPASADRVTVASGHLITLDSSAPASGGLLALTVNGTLIVGNDATARTLTVAGDVTINDGAALQANNPGSSLSHSLLIGGNLTNDGTFDATNSTGVVNVTFNGSASQTVSGSGATTDFNQITINNTGANGNNLVEITSARFTVPASFLTLTAGVLKVSGSFTLSNRFFTAGAYTIPAGAGLWLNNANVTVNAQNGSPRLSGLLRITGGAYNIGTSSGNSLQYESGATFMMEGGALNIAGRFSGAGTTQKITFSMSGGTLTVATVANAASQGSFDIPTAGSSFTMNGGAIVLQNQSTYASGTPVDYRNVAGTAAITGGTVQFGNAATSGSPSFEVGASGGAASLFPSLTIHAAGTPSVNLNTAITVNGNVTVGNGTTLIANAQNISLTGHWTNNGAAGAAFVGQGGTVTFNGSAVQTIDGNRTDFNTMTIDSSATVVVPYGTTQPRANTVNNNGTLQQATAVVSGATVDFLRIQNVAASTDSYRGLDIVNTGTGSTDLGHVTVNISGNQASCPNAQDYPARRCYDIAGSGSSTTTSVAFYITPDELRTGQTPMSLKPWHYTGGSWTEIAKGGYDATCTTASDCYVTGSGITSFSPFVLKNFDPTAVTLAEFGAAQVAGDDAILVTWTTVSELNNRGFNLWRGASAAGPDMKLNETLIPSQSQGLPGGGFVYTWDDRSALVHGTTYYYWVEGLGTDGALTRHEPVSVTYASPTAVRVAGFGAASALPAAPKLLATGLALTALGGIALRRQGRRNK